MWMAAPLGRARDPTSRASVRGSPWLRPNLPLVTLLEMQLDVLFARDAAGRLVATRDPAPRPAPRLHLGRSRAGNVWATRRDVEPATSAALERLCASEPPLASPHPQRGPACREHVLELLAPVAVAAETRGPCFVLPARLPVDPRAREVDEKERADWPDAFPWLAREFEAVAPVALAFEACSPPPSATRPEA